MIFIGANLFTNEFTQSSIISAFELTSVAVCRDCSNEASKQVGSLSMTFLKFRTLTSSLGDL